MKKLLTIALAVASFGLVGLGSEAKAETVFKPATPQFRIQIGPQRRNRRWRNRDLNRGERVGYGYGRTITQTRLVQRGYRTYRETYQIRYFPNGQTQTTLVSRVRVG
jgi:hypothetical protein